MPKQRKFAVFDIDGTVFRSHLYWEVVLGLARQDKLHPSLNKKTLELFENWKKRAYKDSFEIFDKQTVEAIDSLLGELSPVEYDKALAEVLPPLLDQTYLYTRKMIKHLRKEGYFLIALSGSRIEEVTMFAKHHGFDDWIGQNYERTKDGKRYTGNTTKTYKDKHLILENFVKKHDLTYNDSWGFGDTMGDAEMLAVVDNPVAFNPNQTLLEHAKKQSWKVVVERKNVIYEMESKTGYYTLSP